PSSVPAGREGAARTSSGNEGARSRRFRLSSCTWPFVPCRSKPRKPSSFGSYNHWSPIGRLCLSAASIGGNGNTSTGAGGYQSKGNPRHAPESIPTGGTRYVRSGRRLADRDGDARFLFG